MGDADTFFEKARGARILAVDAGASMHMLSKMDLSSGELEPLQKIQDTHNGSDGQWRSANKSKSTSVRLPP